MHVWRNLIAVIYEYGRGGVFIVWLLCHNEVAWWMLLLNWNWVQNCYFTLIVINSKETNMLHLHRIFVLMSLNIFIRHQMATSCECIDINADHILVQGLKMKMDLQFGWILGPLCFTIISHFLSGMFETLNLSQTPLHTCFKHFPLSFLFSSREELLKKKKKKVSIFLLLPNSRFLQYEKHYEFVKIPSCNLESNFCKCKNKASVLMILASTLIDTRSQN